jgi:hypothetical protein
MLSFPVGRSIDKTISFTQAYSEKRGNKNIYIMRVKLSFRVNLKKVENQRVMQRKVTGARQCHSAHQQKNNLKGEKRSEYRSFRF